MRSSGRDLEIFKSPKSGPLLVSNFKYVPESEASEAYVLLSKLPSAFTNCAEFPVIDGFQDVPFETVIPDDG